MSSPYPEKWPKPFKKTADAIIKRHGIKTHNNPLALKRRRSKISYRGVPIASCDDTKLITFNSLQDGREAAYRSLWAAYQHGNTPMGFVSKYLGKIDKELGELVFNG